MDSLTFAVELIKTLVWPVLIIILIIIFRKPIFQMVPFLKKIKIGEIEAEFEKKVNEMKNIIGTDVVPAKKALTFSAQENSLEKILELAELAPNAAVLKAWKYLESAAKKLIAAKGYALEYNTATPYKQMENILEKKNMAELKKVKVFGELRNLRNKIAHAHDFEISPEQAGEYVHLSFSLAQYFLKQAG